MTRSRNLAVAAVVAAGLATAGAAQAAPANLGNVMPPIVSESEAATPAYHWRQRCWPVYRWVWTHWGWRYRYVGHRCAPRYPYRYYHFYHYYPY